MWTALGLTLLAAAGTYGFWAEKLYYRNNGWSISISFNWALVALVPAAVVGEYLLSGELTSGWMAVVNSIAILGLAFKPPRRF